MQLFYWRNSAAAGAIAAILLVDAGAGRSASAAVDAIVPRDFETIQLAVDGAVDADGDGIVHILVRRGTYAENVVIEQRADLVLEGQDAGDTIIFGTGPDATLEIEGSIGVAVTNFTITGDGSGDGVELSLSEVCLIQGNVVMQNDGGIVLTSAGGSTVQENLVQFNDADGILLSAGNGNEIRLNSILNNGGSGIRLSQSGANLIEGNSVLVNGDFGIRAQTGNFNVIRLNRVSKNGSDGLRVGDASQTQIRENAVYKNRGNGIRMIGTQDSLVSRNAITGNRKFGVSLQNTADDDWNASRSGVQSPPGDNRVAGNVRGNVKQN